MAYPELVKLEGKVRETSKKANKALREELRVPAVLYGPDVEENVHFSIDELELEKILRKPQTKLQELTVDGKSYKTLLKRTEFDPVTDRPIHADFYVLADDQKVTLRVPIKITGNAKGVVENGGRVFKPMNFVRIRVLPSDIPAEFEIDISPLEIGQSFHISDLDLEGIIPLDDLSRTIVTIRPPKGADFLENLVAGITDETEEEVVAEGEAAEGEELAEGEEAPEGEEGEDSSEEKTEE
ncbi:MAG: 50S ribosomal protein L25 [Gracilimonas sp.]|uniref:50S ribosomal protein L25 n=1 Tax=Gracilimonas TaxID=649462 RepID=UPI001B21B5ED|nr:50S ribosomal protein L25 [Gracilimonas sp.]MBO6587392.1 50S ribosomal protein L25 [Gracilimonas sp.]MBO6614122.1 50S ribosomal protein L25 [Gracilimonas sp.]